MHYWRRFRYVIFFVVLAGIGAASYQSSRKEAVQKSHVQKNPKLAKGEHLRAEMEAIDRAAESLPKENEAIREALLRHIPVGTSFDDAETILRAAGFSLSFRHVTSSTEVAGRQDYVLATMLDLNKSGILVKFSTEVYVYVFPSTPGIFDRVGMIRTFLNAPLS